MWRITQPLAPPSPRRDSTVILTEFSVVVSERAKRPLMLIPTYNMFIAILPDYGTIITDFSTTRKFDEFVAPILMELLRLHGTIEHRRDVCSDLLGRLPQQWDMPKCRGLLTSER